MDKKAFREPLHVFQVWDLLDYKKNFKKEHPHYFWDVGTTIFCGHQGAGKTLSAVNYIYRLFEQYPLMIVVSNVSFTDYPFNAGYRVVNGICEIYDLQTDARIYLGDYLKGERNDLQDCKYEYICIEYDGLDCLKYIANGECGVLYFIDELQLELNSLESKNIDIDVMVEICQQRKQRKKIVGTSQVFTRLHKQVREQVFDLVFCDCYFGCFQKNINVDGFTVKEENGKLRCSVKSRSYYFHTPEMYNRYDTYAKMRRYSKEWMGHKRDSYVQISSPQISHKGKKLSVNY